MTEELFVRWEGGAVVEGPMVLPDAIPQCLNFRLHPTPWEFNWFAFTQSPVPEGKVSVSFTDVLDVATRAVHRSHILSDAPAPEAPVPARVTSAQAQMALYNVGLLDDVEAMVASHPYQPVRIWYHKALHWEWGNVYVQAFGLELGLSDTAMRDLFAAAKLLA